MAVKKFLASFSTAFLLALFLISLSSKISFAQNCTDQGGICMPETVCGQNNGSVMPNSGPGSGMCTGTAICCTGSTTCESQGGTCSTSCTGETKSFFCPEGPSNVCCISSTTTPTTPTTPTNQTSDQQQIQMALSGAWNAKTNAMNSNQPSLDKLSRDTWLNSLINATATLKGDGDPFLPSNQQNLSGIIGLTTNLIANLYTPQASGIQYLAELKNNILGKPAYAQGVGFRGLQPILPIWRGFRNVVYILSSLIFIIIGIMLMLRVKISPQAVITIQSAIPQLITTLILVTFSYAIAGLLIDLSYLIQNLAIAILFQTQANGLSGTLFPGASFDSHFAGLTNGNIWTVNGLMWRALPFWALTSLGSTITGIIGGTAGSMGIILGGMAATPALFVGFLLGAVCFLLILLIIITIWLLKFFFGLLKCYVTIIFKIVIAPLEIGIGAFPNLKIGFSSWLIDLIANLAVFPISYLFLIVGNLIIDKVSTSTTPLWTPNLLSSNTVTNLSGGLIKPAYAAEILTTGLSGGLVAVLIGLALLGMVANLPKLITEAVFQIKESLFGKAIGEAYGTNVLAGLGKTITGGVKTGFSETVGGLSGGFLNKRFIKPAKRGMVSRAKERSEKYESQNLPPNN